VIPGKYNMLCPQGSTFNQSLTYSIDGVPVNLTGYAARMQVKEKYSSTVKQLDLTTSNGGITLGGALGTITINATATQTSTIVPKEYIYDLELVYISTVNRIIEGKFIVTPEVTI
jgi:hypothetical protein